MEKCNIQIQRPQPFWIDGIFYIFCMSEKKVSQLIKEELNGKPTVIGIIISVCTNNIRCMNWSQWLSFTFLCCAESKSDWIAGTLIVIILSRACSLIASETPLSVVIWVHLSESVPEGRETKQCLASLPQVRRWTMKTIVSVTLFRKVNSVSALKKVVDDTKRCSQIPAEE